MNKKELFLHISLYRKDEISFSLDTQSLNLTFKFCFKDTTLKQRQAANILDGKEQLENYFKKESDQSK